MARPGRYRVSYVRIGEHERLLRASTLAKGRDDYDGRSELDSTALHFGIRDPETGSVVALASVAIVELSGIGMSENFKTSDGVAVSGDVAWIYNVCVAESHRGRGLSKMLMNRVFRSILNNRRVEQACLVANQPGPYLALGLPVSSREQFEMRVGFPVTPMIFDLDALREAGRSLEQPGTSLQLGRTIDVSEGAPAPSRSSHAALSRPGAAVRH